MNVEQLVVFLLIGGVAGWLAGLITKGGGFGLTGNVIAGVIGAILGGWLFGVLGISIGGKWVGPLVTATAGAVLLLFAIGLLRKK
ncbi:MAG TPA: GlsB/YeaQ/YmgE family stress response membrane protein [Kiritimatiellia bacterium]|nr:GlsB/YeaQ/YmgE family stress response membrane protein [Kiritimatiellia bacterium]